MKLLSVHKLNNILSKKLKPCDQLSIAQILEPSPLCSSCPVPFWDPPLLWMSAGASPMKGTEKKKHFNSKVEENYIEPGAHNWTMSSGGALLPTNVDRTLRFYTSNVNLTKVEKQSLNDWTTGYLGNWLILFPSNLACEQVYLSKFRENFPRTSKNEPAYMLPRIGGDSGATNLLFPSRP